MPRLTQQNVDNDIDELVQAFSRLAILPTAASELERVVESAATLQLHDTTTNQLKTARHVAIGDKNDMVIEDAFDCYGTPLTDTQTTTTTNDTEPDVEQFPRHGPRPAKPAPGYKLDETNLRFGVLKRNGQRFHQKLRDEARRMQADLRQCLRWLHHNHYIRKGMADRFAAVEGLRDELVKQLARAGHLSGALVNWRPSDVDRLVTWKEILVVQARLAAMKTSASEGTLPRKN